MNFVALTLVGTLTVAGTVYAMPVAWSDADNKFELTLPTGWRLHSPQIAGPTSIFVAGPEGKSPAEFGCVINRRDHVAAGEVTQDAANLVIESWDQALVVENSRISGMRDTSVKTFSNETRGKVRVVKLDLNGSLGGSAVQSSKVQFMLAMGGIKASFFTVSCLAPLSATAEETAGVRALTSSLSFK